MASSNSIFDAGRGIPDNESWLDRKMMRREMSDTLNRQAIDICTQRATSAAQKFLDDLREKAELRSDIERKSEEIRLRHQEELRRQAEQYRSKLRGYLRPELRD
ncbi:MAG TPA: hypothetical protein V6D22_05445 [Candidatus Obscuribacterales bacterium]